jgi:hypothetical protein
MVSSVLLQCGPLGVTLSSCAVSVALFQRGQLEELCSQWSVVYIGTGQW